MWKKMTYCVWYLAIHFYVHCNHLFWQFSPTMLRTCIWVVNIHNTMDAWSYHITLHIRTVVKPADSSSMALSTESSNCRGCEIKKWWLVSRAAAELCLLMIEQYKHTHLLPSSDEGGRVLHPPAQKVPCVLEVHWAILDQVKLWELKTLWALLTTPPTHPHSLHMLQKCQVTLISRVRPAFWPVNQHSLDENLN